MKKQKQWLYACLILLSSITGQLMNAQTYCGSSSCEMICNGGFETTTTPTGPNQLTNTADWIVTARTPDIFSTLSTVASGVNAPCNNAGYQMPHSGNCYAGLLTNGFLNGGNPFGWAEGMAAPLSDNLIGEKIYDVSFYVSAGELNTFYNKNLKVDIDGVNVYTVPVSLLNSYTNWVLVSFPYCANGGESVLSIYSVNDNSFTPSSPITTSGCTYTSNPSGGTYIYIDDVSMKEAKFSVASKTVCLNTPVTVTAVPTCSINTGNYTYEWNYGDGSTAVNTGTNNSSTHSYTNFSTYTGSVTISTGTCAITYTYNISVPNMTIAVTSNSTMICNGTTSFTAALAPSGTYTVSWAVHDATTHTVIPTGSYTVSAGTTTAPAINFANINQNVCVVVSITNTLGCTFRDSICLPACCPTPTNAVKYTNPTYNTTAALPGTFVVLSGVVTINSGGNLVIGNKNVAFDPNTKIVVNGTGKITVLNSYLHGCNYMWDGIYLNGTGLSSINTSDVEDAKRVIIDSLGTAGINVFSSYLNKNHEGIVVKAAKTNTSSFIVRNTLFTCSNLPVPTSSPWAPTIPSLGNAATFGAYTSASLLPPYSTEKSLCGIHLENASHTGKTNSAITIGATTGQENIFDKIQTGAFINQSNVAFQNNMFQGIKSSIAPTTLFNAGILVVGKFFGAGPYNTQIGGGSTSLKNTFLDNDYGVANIYATALSIENNRFEAQNTGVYVTVNYNNSIVNTSHNKFINNLVGINYDQNTLIDATILENWMDNTSATGSYADNYAIRCTESVLATDPLSYPKYDVNNNYINGYYNGIYVGLTLNSVVRDNEVHMRPDNTAYHYQSGIASESTNNAEVKNNLVDMASGTSLDWWKFGLFTAGSTVPKFHCNSTNYVGVGILANGLNYTTAGNGFYGNSMSNAAFGFWLNAGGEIGNQYYTSGATNYSADNSWTSCTNETFVSSGCNTASAIFYTRSTSPYNITSPGGSTPLLLGTNSSTGFTGACYTGGSSTPTLNLRTGDAHNVANLMQNAEEIAAGTVSFASDVNLLQIARKQLYGNLSSQLTDADNVSSALADFVRNNKTLGSFLAVDRLIHTGDKASLERASGINTGLAAVNDVDATQQSFNSQYIAFIKQGRKADYATIAGFEAIANLCPVVNGNAVYQARSVLFNLTRKKYVNACEFSNSRLQESTSLKSGAGSLIKLYPNPNNGSFTIETGDDLTYSFEVYNMLGEKVYQKMISNKQELDLQHLPTAAYIAKLVGNGKTVKTQRISIIH